MFQAQILLNIVCLLFDITLGICLGESPKTETIISWINLFLFVIVFLWIGNKYLKPQDHWMKNAGSVLFTCAVSFCLIISLDGNYSNMEQFVRLTVLFFNMPVQWAWDFKIPIWNRGLFIFIPSLSAFIGLYSRFYKKKHL